MSDSFATTWTVALQAPLSVGFPKQEYWSELPFPSPRDLPHPGIKLTSPTLAGGVFTTTWEALLPLFAPLPLATTNLPSVSMDLSHLTACGDTSFTSHMYFAHHNITYFKYTTHRECVLYI